MSTIDQAIESQETLTGFTIEAIRRNAKRSLLFSGHCYYCDEVVGSPHLFCDLDCRDDWENEKRLKEIAGKR